MCVLGGSSTGHMKMSVNGDSGTQRTSFQFYSTLQNTTYRFSIAAVNEVGEGPEAESSITTPSPAVQEEEQWLFLSRKTSLRKRSLKHLVDEAHCLQSEATHHNITGQCNREKCFLSV